ncbi:hypothetical protein NN561_004149 [Cricetulus griseus]
MPSPLLLAKAPVGQSRLRCCALIQPGPGTEQRPPRLLPGPEPPTLAPDPSPGRILRSVPQAGPRDHASSWPQPTPHSDAERRVSATSVRPRAGGQGRRGDPASTGLRRQVTPGRWRPKAPHSPSAAARPRGRLHAGPSQRSLPPYCYLALSDPAARHPMAARSRARHHQAAQRRGGQCASASHTHALRSTWVRPRSRK